MTPQKPALSAEWPTHKALFGNETGDETDKFTRFAWSPDPHAVPLLDECMYRFAGTIDRQLDLGDHVGFLLTPVEMLRRRQPPTKRPMHY